MTAFTAGFIGSRKSSGWHVADIIRVPGRMLAALAKGHERARQRAQLAELPDYRLKDLGLSRGQAYLESVKPFWKA